jgi:hypothetical protein
MRENWRTPSVFVLIAFERFGIDRRFGAQVIQPLVALASNGAC